MDITTHPRSKSITVTMSAAEAILVRDALEAINPTEPQLKNLDPEFLALELSYSIERILPG